MKFLLKYFHRSRRNQRNGPTASVKTTQQDNKTTTESLENIDNDSSFSIDNKHIVLTVDNDTDANEIASRKALDVATRLINAYNTDTDELRNLLTPSMFIQFDDGVELLSDNIIELTAMIRKSFPDFNFSFEKMEVISPGNVLIYNVQPTGTHTGEPFAFGPYEPIDARGIRFQNDPEDFRLSIDTDKEVVTFWRSAAKGPKTGPQSIYEQIGGLII